MKRLPNFTVFVDPWGRFDHVPDALLKEPTDHLFWTTFAQAFSEAPPRGKNVTTNVGGDGFMDVVLKEADNEPFVRRAIGPVKQVANAGRYGWEVEIVVPTGAWL